MSYLSRTFSSWIDLLPSLGFDVLEVLKTINSLWSPSEFRDSSVGMDSILVGGIELLSSKSYCSLILEEVCGFFKNSVLV